MKTKRLYMYWLIKRFMLNYKYFSMICTAHEAETILYNFALVLLISVIICACTFCIHKQFLKGVMEKQHRFSNNSHNARECLCSYTIINYNNG